MGNYVKDFILRAEGASQGLEQRSWGDLHAYRAFCAFCQFQAATSSHPCTLLPRGQNTDPAFSGSLQHQPPTHPAPSSHMAQCLPLCAGWEGTVLANAWKPLGGLQKGQVTLKGPGTLPRHRFWIRDILVTMCDLGYHLTFEP